MKQTEILTHATHVNGWEPAVYMSCMSQNFRLFHVSNLSVRNFRIFLLMYTGSPSHNQSRPAPAATPGLASAPGEGPFITGTAAAAAATVWPHPASVAGSRESVHTCVSGGLRSETAQTPPKAVYAADSRLGTHPDDRRRCLKHTPGRTHPAISRSEQRSPATDAVQDRRYM